MKLTSARRRSILGTLASASVPALWPCQGADRGGARVIVIGAGVSGLAAAQALEDVGIAVTVLEARNRIGGRVHTERGTFGVPVEIGAQFIQGKKNEEGEVNPTWEMVRQAGWKSVLFDPQSASAVRDGEFVDAGDLAEGLEAFQKFLLEEVKSEAEVGDSVEDALKVFIGEHKLDAREAAGLRAMAVSEVGTEYAGDLSQMSAKNFGEDSGYDTGGTVMLPEGYDQVPKFLARGLKDVRLGELVASIDTSGEFCVVTTNKGEYRAHHVICTLPLGVLQAGSVRFNPALPEAKTKAIGRMGMGQLGKVILKFPRRFWPADANWFLSLKSSAPWGVGFASLEAVHPGQNLIVMWHHGALARQREELDDNALVRIALDELRAASGEDVPQPTSRLITRWGRDPFSRGAYFFPKVGSPISDVAELAKPVGKRLFFAGEATNADYFATVHGAIASGRREARKIMQLIS
jgi:polyamine oxidase